ncbi:MAG TPA: TolC family protein [Candidatus Angelobacter sp.]|nr:TolC family protein [Candidatus Angelobacter sp.]
MKFRVRVAAILGGFLLFASASLEAQNAPIAFRTMIELAVRNSASSGISQAELLRARAGFSQSKNLFLPQVTLGSGLAFSYGFPLSLEGSAPSIVRVDSQEFLFNPAQKEFIKAARSEVETTRAQSVDRRNEVMLETAIDYMQLDLLQSSLAAQREQQEFAAKYEDVVSQRVQAGLDSALDLTRAKLAAAKTRLALADTRAAIDQLRLRLAQLTGLPLDSVQTSTETIPELPAVSQDADLSSQAMSRDSAVKVAEQAAIAKGFRAKGEEKQLYPAVDLVANYAVLARYNNYDVFFNHFQRNNATIGVAIRFPFLNPAQKALARSAEADYLKAQKDVQAAKDRAGADALRLQRSVAQLSAANEVTKLEHQLAEADVETIHEKIQTGGASLKDEQSARITEHERYTNYLDSTFQLDRAQVQLLRQIGELEGWALGPVRR